MGKTFKNDVPMNQPTNLKRGVEIKQNIEKVKETNSKTSSKDI